MTYRENFRAIMHYEKWDSLPVIHFGYWFELVEEWVAQGHITLDDAEGRNSDTVWEGKLSKKLGFDYGWDTHWQNLELLPGFESKVLETFPDGSRYVLDGKGVVIHDKPGQISIPAEIRHTLTDRVSWEKEYKWRIAYSDERLNLNFDRSENRELPYGLHVGSLMGQVRDWLGLVGLSYMLADDEELFYEIVNSFADMQYKVIEKCLKTFHNFDFAHYWEDICYKQGPLMSPKILEELIGPHYRRMADLLKSYGIDIVSVDCDGKIDELIPMWLENGVNTMFPIEIGVWNADFMKWRKQYGRQIHGVGGVDKRVFTLDYKAVDAEIERIRPAIEDGGYIPCPDHRLQPGCKFENIQYFTDKLHRMYSK